MSHKIKTQPIQQQPPPSLIPISGVGYMDQNRTNDELQFYKAKAYTKLAISSELFHKKAKFCHRTLHKKNQYTYSET